MTTMEELQKAWNKVFGSMEKLAKALNNVLEHMCGSEKKTREIYTGRKHKFVNRVPDSKMSTYNYKPAMRRNLPYQRRNF